MAKSVVVDSDAIFAIYNPNDPLNKRAIQTLKKLISLKFMLIYPSSVIFEIISLFQRVLPTPTVNKRLVEMIRSNELSIFTVDSDIIKESSILFDPSGSKKNTLVDCSVVVVTKKIKADGVFSYDRLYEKQGLRLAEDLIL